MAELLLENAHDALLCVFVEPSGEDYWIAPGQKLRFKAATSEPGVDCIWHSQGISVWMNDDAYGFVVTTDAGETVACGYQRPAGAFENHKG